jgi:hypothetical protein
VDRTLLRGWQSIDGDVAVGMSQDPCRERKACGHHPCHHRVLAYYGSDAPPAACPSPKLRPAPRD